MNKEQWLDECVKNNPEMTRAECEEFLKNLLELYATKGVKPPPRYRFDE